MKNPWLHVCICVVCGDYLSTKEYCSRKCYRHKNSLSEDQLSVVRTKYKMVRIVFCFWSANFVISYILD